MLTMRLSRKFGKSIDTSLQDKQIDEELIVEQSKWSLIRAPADRLNLMKRRQPKCTRIN